MNAVIGQSAGDFYAIAVVYGKFRLYYLVNNVNQLPQNPHSLATTG